MNWSYGLHTQIQIRHRTQRSGCYGAGVFGQHTASVSGPGRFPGFLALFEFCQRNVEVELSLLGINSDWIAIFHQGQRAAHVGLRRNVAYNKTMAAAGKSAISDQRHILAESLAHDRRRRRKHFSHPWSAFRAFETDNDDVTLDDAIIENFFQSSFLRIKHPCATSETETFFSCDFSDGALRRKVAIEDYQVAVLFDRIIQ